MIKKFFIILFNVLGFLTFLALVSAAAFFGIRHYKSQAITEATTTADTTGAIRIVSMTPEKTDNVATPSQTLPHFQPISRKPVSASKTKSVRKTAPAVSAKPAPTPATYAAPKVRQTVIVEKARPKPAKPRPTKQPATTVHADLGMPAEPNRLYRATDHRASPRTGGSRVPDVTAPPSELERQAMRHAENIRQLEEETAKLRNPPVEQTDLMKLLSGGGK